MMRSVRRLCAALLACLPLLAGAAQARTVPVHDTATLSRAIAAARAGDDIVLADGVYAIAGKLRAEARGTADAPITVRAAHRWRAELRASGVIAFEVTGPHWTFRDLDIRGVCARDSDCEHAFHVVGAAYFSLLGNRLADFNAHLKVNADFTHKKPLAGLVDGNEIFNTHPRRTANPVEPLNIDNADNWVVRRNFIYDFHKDGGNGVSYGVFVKGGSQAPLFERNLILCARKDEVGGARVGMSFGGGGMGPALCAPHWDAATPCDPEVTGGVMRNNIIANCSDVGVYLNRAAGTQLLFNTILRTRGVEFRFPSSTGVARGNLLANTIRGRDGGGFTDGGNLVSQLSTTVEAWYRDPDGGDLRLKATPAALLGAAPADPSVTRDFCGRPRTAPYDIGALQSSLGDCPTLP
ncbi:MAG: hypothetical protein J0H91_17820 [Rhodospirillales bacterium]|nr:hypothetical protein [Rhodospirillales bacterium]